MRVLKTMKNRFDLFCEGTASMDISSETRDKILQSLIRQAMRGNITAAKIVLEVFDRQQESSIDRNAPIYQLLKRIDEECGTGG